jgi:antitoxin VapB
MMKTTKTFKSGNSVAVRLPKALGVAPGVEMIVREERGRYVVEPVQAAPKKIDLTGIAGSMPWLKPLTPEERIMEPRKLDWEGKLLKRD